MKGRTALLEQAFQVLLHLIAEACGDRPCAQPMEAIMRKIHDPENLPSFQHHA
jgi:hypothetical protein